MTSDARPSAYYMPVPQPRTLSKQEWSDFELLKGVCDKSPRRLLLSALPSRSLPPLGSQYFWPDDVMKRVGQELFPGEWQEADLTARPDLLRPIEPMPVGFGLDSFLSPHKNPAENIKKARTRESIWVCQTEQGLKGFHEFWKEQHAIAAWERCGPALLQEFDAEVKARARFMTVLMKVLELLGDGALQVDVHDPSTGNLLPAPESFWRSLAGRTALDWNSDFVRWMDAVVYGSSVVGGLELETTAIRKGFFKFRRAAVEAVLNSDTFNESPIEAPSSRGLAGARGLAAADQRLVAEIISIVGQDGISDHAAAQRVVARALGGGSDESKIRRLVRRVRSQRALSNSP